MNKSNDIKTLIKELLSLTNRPEIDISTMLRMKDLICYLSDQRKKGNIPENYLSYLDFILYSAATRLRSFGYNRQNRFNINDFYYEGIGLWKDETISNYYKTNSGAVLDRYQKEVMDTFVENNHRLFLSAPTSFGKTFLLKEIIFSNYERYSNIVIVLPTVALLMEVSQDLREFFKDKQMAYSIYTSVYRDLELTEKNAFILTPERVLRLLALREEIELDFIFFDEVYKIDEDIASSDEENVSSTIDIGDNTTSKSSSNSSKEHRAVAFRLALYLLMEKQPECYIAGPFISFKSAKSGLKQFIEKYRIKTIEVNYEPTLKNRIDYHGKKLKSVSSVTGEDVITTPASQKIDKLRFLTQQLSITPDEPALVYCLYPGFTEKYARQYCEGMCIVQDKDISIFIEHIEHNYNCRFSNGTKNSIDEWDFLYALKRGTGIHNGKFPKYFQREIMTLFNSNRMPLLFCTSTIVEGVNTNAKTIILYNNPSGENEAGKRFLLLNINGRAGRYLRHFVGNIVYLDKQCLIIEKAANISLDFKPFSSDVILDKIDLENIAEKYLSPRNRQLKNGLSLDRDLLPDSVFIQNRLIERVKQESILKKIITRIKEFRNIESVSIANFIKQGYFQTILQIWAEVGEINPNQIDAIKYFAQNYAANGYLGVLNYSFGKYAGEDVNKFVNETYRRVFKNVKDTIEYQLPRIISLFESLINRAFELIGEPFDTPLDLSRIIRYFEIGATTLLGVDMIENGVPIITVRKIEKYDIKGDTLTEQKEFFKSIKNKIHFDEYEKKLIDMYIAE